MVEMELAVLGLIDPFYASDKKKEKVYIGPFIEVPLGPIRAVLLCM